MLGKERFQLIRQVFGDDVFAHPDGLVNIPQRVLDNGIILGFANQNADGWIVVFGLSERYPRQKYRN